MIHYELESSIVKVMVPDALGKYCDENQNFVSWYTTLFNEYDIEVILITNNIYLSGDYLITSVKWEDS